MAKRKAARAGRAGAAAKRARTGGSRGGAKKKKATKATKRAASKTRSSARKAARKSARKGGGTAKSTRKSARKPAAARKKTTARKSVARKHTAARKASARKSTRSAPRATPRSSGAGKAAVPLRKSPALDRPRRVVTDDNDQEDIVQSTPPSSLDLDRSASAVRTGRRSLRDRFSEHTETSPALTGGDVDADWESAYSVGDEAPGGDNPTPDQDIVDDIGRAVGIEYQDNEELKGADKLEKRDRKRWELDPASSEDWDER